MIKSPNCPEYVQGEEKSILELFTRCFDAKWNSVDSSTAISEWRLDNYSRVSDNDFKMMQKFGFGDAFKLFVDILSETYGLHHITEPPKFTTGMINQSKMTLARKSPRQEKSKNYAWKRRENQLSYVFAR